LLIPIPLVDLTHLQPHCIRKFLDNGLIPVWILIEFVHQNMMLGIILPLPLPFPFRCH